MTTLIVYRCDNKYWIHLLRDSSAESKKKFLSVGQKKELFSVSGNNDVPFTELARKVVTKAKLLGIRDVKCATEELEDFLRRYPIEE